MVPNHLQNWMILQVGINIHKEILLSISTSTHPSPCRKLRHSHASPLGTCGVTTKIRQAEIGKLTSV